MGQYVPRQRKRKVLERERAKSTSRRHVVVDTNVVEVLTPNKREILEKKEQLRQELQRNGVKVSSKKAKRLEKYVGAKLRKDQNRSLLAQLADTRIDTSLFTSTRELGRGAAFANRDRSFDASGQSQEEIAGGVQEDGEAKDHADEKGNTRKNTFGEPPVLVAKLASEVGVGLKRPLDVDEDGMTVITKRLKRGGVKSKFSGLEIRNEKPINNDLELEDWSGFSSDNMDEPTIPATVKRVKSWPPDLDHAEEDDWSQNGLGSGTTEAGLPDQSASKLDEFPDGSDSTSSQDSDRLGGNTAESDDESRGDADSDGGALASDQRSSAFKMWAQQQRNVALDYQPADFTQAADTPRPVNFTPHPVEVDALPAELQPSRNLERKAFAVAILRSQDMEEARLRLPIVAEEQRIMEAVHNHDVVIICGETGSGKTTQVPQFLYEAGYGAPDSPTPGMVGVTQPRRVAAVSMSRRVAAELGDHGHTVAYQIRFKGTVDPKTVIKFMTDGVLLREVAQDIALRRYSAIVIDEAHERCVNTDILIGMLSRIVKLRRELSLEDQTVPPLKLVIMSATLRVEDFTMNRVLFPIPPPVIEVEGRQHHVTMHFSRRTRHDYIDEAFHKITRGHKKLPAGGFLVFLTGQNEIVQLSRKLKVAAGGAHIDAPHVRLSAVEAAVEVEEIEFGDLGDTRVDDAAADEEIDNEDDGDPEDKEFDIGDEAGAAQGPSPGGMHILPLYSLLPTAEQLRVFQPPPEGSRLVVVATNVAETSLTIPGIRYVFDCGRSKQLLFRRGSGVQSYEIGWISKASARQRAGRAGRTGPGHCYRLYSSAVYERDFPLFAEPELLQVPIEGIVLQLKAMNLQHVLNFPFPSPPDRGSLARAERLLTYLSAVSPAGQITPVGQTMSIFPLAPRFSRILLVGHAHDCLSYTVALVAALSAPEVFIPENQAVPAAAETSDSRIRTNADALADSRRNRTKRLYDEAHRNFCFLDDRSDVIKLLQVVGEFAHESTEEWCDRHFVRFKVLSEIQHLRRQITSLLSANIPCFSGVQFQDRLDPPSPKQVSALKQMMTAGFIDQVAMRADLSPSPAPMNGDGRKPRRAIDVPYLPMNPLEPAPDDPSPDPCIYIHPTSSLAHLSPPECPEYVVYTRLQRAAASPDTARQPRTRMLALTDVTGGQLAVLARGTPLITYGKPVKEAIAAAGAGDAVNRECWVVPYLRAEGAACQGWPLPLRRVKQRKVAGKGWVVE